MIFFLQWHSASWETLIMFLSQFPLTTLQTREVDFPFHYTAYDYSLADQDGLCGQLRDIPWEDIFKPSVSAAATDICE